MRSSPLNNVVLLFFLPVFFMLSPVVIYAQPSGKFTDSRDRHEYSWVRFGRQTWMGQNLKYKAERGCWSFNEDDSVNLPRYGRMYDWQAASKACPPGWRLPSDKDWTRLIAFLGAENAGRVFQSMDTLGKSAGEKENLRISNFSSLLSGIRYPDGRFLYLTYWGGCWSSKEVNDSSAIYYLFARKSGETGSSTNDKRSGFSVRCIKK